MSRQRTTGILIESQAHDWGSQSFLTFNLLRRKCIRVVSIGESSTVQFKVQVFPVHVGGICFLQEVGQFIQFCDYLLSATYEKPCNKSTFQLFIFLFE